MGLEGCSMNRLDGDDSVHLTTFNTIRHSDSNSVLDGSVSATDTEGSLVSWASAALVPPGRRELVPVDDTTFRNVGDGEIHLTLLAGVALHTTDRSNGVDDHVAVGIEVVNRIVVSKVRAGYWCLRAGLGLNTGKLEVASEPETILTDSVEDFLTDDMTIVALEETTTNGDEVTSLSVEDGDVVQEVEPLGVEEAASDEHVSVIQPGGLPDIVVDTVVLGSTHPDLGNGIVLADTVVLHTLCHIDGIIEDVAASESIENTSLVDHEAAHKAGQFLLECGAAVKRHAGHAGHTLREVLLIKRAQVPVSTVAESVPILSGVVPLCNVVGEVLMLSVEVDKGECTTNVDVSGSLGSIKTDAVDRQRVLCSQRAETVTHGAVLTSRSDADDLRRKVANHFSDLLASRRSDVQITVDIPDDVLNRWVASATVALDLEIAEARHERRPGVGCRIIDTDTLEGLGGTIEPEASVVPLHTLGNCGKALRTLSCSVESDGPVALLPVVAPNMPSVVLLSLPGTTHVEDVTDPEQAGDVWLASAAVETSLAAHWASLGVAEGALPVLNAGVGGDIEHRDVVGVVVGGSLLGERRALLGEIDVGIPPGKEVALEGAVLLGDLANTAEGTVEEHIITNDGETADGHGEAAQARTHLLPGVGSRIVADSAVDVSAASVGRVDEARIRSASLLTTKGTSDVDLAVRALGDGVGITAKATAAGGIGPYLVDRIPAGNCVNRMRRVSALLEGTNDPDIAVVTDEEVVDGGLIEVGEISGVLEDLLVLDHAVPCLGRIGDEADVASVGAEASGVPAGATVALDAAVTANDVEGTTDVDSAGVGARIDANLDTSATTETRNHVHIGASAEAVDLDVGLIALVAGNRVEAEALEATDDPELVGVGIVGDAEDLTPWGSVVLDGGDEGLPAVGGGLVLVKDGNTVETEVVVAVAVVEADEATRNDETTVRQPEEVGKLAVWAITTEGGAALPDEGAVALLRAPGPHTPVDVGVHLWWEISSKTTLPVTAHVELTTVPFGLGDGWDARTLTHASLATHVLSAGWLGELP